MLASLVSTVPSPLLSAPACALLVLNWNGARWLEKCLPSLVTAAEAVPGARVVVVDGDSHDGSERVCREQFPSVAWEPLGVNKVLAGYNIAAARCPEPVLVLLNNDLVADPSFLPPLLAALRSAPDVFAVSVCMRGFPPAPDAPIERQAETPRWTGGMLRADGDSAAATVPDEARGTLPTFYACGGALACDRARFLELGGFDELFLPGYYEDVDLCWRAWKRGWTCLYEPRAVVYHAGGASMGRSPHVHALIARNEFLFHWKNLTTPAWLLRHLLSLPPRLLVALARGDRARLRGFAQAVALLPRALSARRTVGHAVVRDDAAVVRFIREGHQRQAPA